MKCREVMNKNVLICHAQNSALACAAAMRDHDVGFAPVVDDDGRVVGAITDRDLTVRVLASGRPATEPIEMVMERDVVKCGPEDDLSQAEALMARHQLRRIVIVDGSDCPIGVISLGDIVMNESSSEQTHRVAQAINHPTPPDQPRT